MELWKPKETAWYKRERGAFSTWLRTAQYDLTSPTIASENLELLGHLQIWQLWKQWEMAASIDSSFCQIRQQGQAQLSGASLLRQHINQKWPEVQSTEGLPYKTCPGNSEGDWGSCDSRWGQKCWNVIRHLLDSLCSHRLVKTDKFSLCEFSGKIRFQIFFPSCSC